MNIQVERADDIAVLSVHGSVDSLTADDLLAEITTQVEQGFVCLVGDLTALEYTSSAGLRALLGGLKTARQHGGDLRLAAVRPAVLKILDLSGFSSILKLYDDVAAARASYAR
jgi:anti-sigma B factor antagonist